MTRLDLNFLRFVHHNWIWPPQGKRILIAELNAPEPSRAFVCADGTFSPGVGSFGVTALYRSSDRKLSRPVWQPGGDVEWHCVSSSRSPRSELTFNFREFRVSETLIACNIQRSPAFYWRITAHNRGPRQDSLIVYVCIRAFGPAGAPVYEIRWNQSAQELLVNNRHALRASRKPARIECASYTESGLDISAALGIGGLSRVCRVRDHLGLASCALVYEISLAAGECAQLDFAFPGVTGIRAPEPDFTRAEAESEAKWAQRLAGFNVSLPDRSLQEALYGSLHNILGGIWGGEAHISPVSYPMRWLRDGVYMVDTLLKAGFQQLALSTIRGFGQEPWAGGAGPEADAPGELLWAIGEYSRYTQDVLPPDLRAAARRAAKTIEDMRWIEAGAYAVNSVPIAWPDERGLIRGKMDYGIQPVWVNAWAIRGLFEAANLLGDTWRVNAERFMRTFTRHIIAPRVKLASRLRGTESPRDAGALFDNPRDLSCILWPCRAAAVDIRPWAKAYFQTVKVKQDAFQMDPNWRYFDLAQAHNYLWAGLPELAWKTLDAYLIKSDAPAGWAEIGGSDIDRARWNRLLSTEAPEVVLPHGWVSAEMFLLLRDMLFFEDGQRLVLLSGFRPQWFASGKPVEVVAPTPWGQLSMTARLDGTLLVGEFHLEGVPPGGVVLAFPHADPLELPTEGGPFSIDIRRRKR